MKITVTLTKEEARCAKDVLDQSISSMDNDGPGERYKAGCRKIYLALSEALD